MKKTRYILLAFLAVEIASIPTAVAMLKTVSLDFGPQIAAAQLPTLTPGHSRYLVSTNADFTVTASDYVGEMRVIIQQRGEIAGLSFGAASQLPGPAYACAATRHLSESVVYRANRPTASDAGSAVDQAVVLVVQHDPAAQPELVFVAETDAPEAFAC